MKRLRLFLLCAIWIAVGTQRAMALPIALDFSFVDFVTGNSVTGIVSLYDDIGSTSASSVFVTANSGGYGVGEYVGTPAINVWTVTDGVVAFVDFVSFGIYNSSPDVTCCSLGFVWQSGVPVYGGLSALTNTVNFIPQSTVAFTPHVEVPVPPVIALLGVGLVGLGFSRRNRKLQN